MRTAVAKRQAAVDTRLAASTRSTARYFDGLKSKSAWRAAGRRLIADAEPAGRKWNTDGWYMLYAIDQTEPNDAG